MSFPNLWETSSNFQVFYKVTSVTGDTRLIKTAEEPEQMVQTT